MNRLVFLGLVLFGALHAYPAVDYDFTVRLSDGSMAKRFEIATQRQPSITIWKRAIDAPTHYDIYDSKGEWDGEAIACFFCLNLLYEWGIEIEIFNKEDLRVGFIEGHSDGKAAARIDLYNARSQLVGQAYLGTRCDEITVYRPHGRDVLATFERVSDSSGPDFWKVHVADRRQINPRILQVLAAWAIDRQDAFLRYE